jgi:hypothetical protein
MVREGGGNKPTTSPADFESAFPQEIFALATKGDPARLTRHNPAAARSRDVEIRHFICLFRSGSRRRIRQHFHPGTLYIPSEHYRTDAKPPTADKYSVFKKTIEWQQSGFLGTMRKYYLSWPVSGPS